MLFKTTNFQAHNQQHLCFNCDLKAIAKHEIDSIINWLETELKRGKIFESGEFIQFGCFLNKLQLMEDNCIHILEPDMKVLPINFVDSLTNTLRYYTRQKYTSESIPGIDSLFFPSIRDSIIVSRNYKTIDDIYMCRDTLEKDFSGWMVKDVVGDNSDTDLISIYEFAISRADLLDFLALPVGFATRMKKGSAIKIFNIDAEINIESNSYLDSINRHILGLPLPK